MEITYKGLIELQRFYRAAPGEFGKASAGVLSALATRTQQGALTYIQSRMTVRSPRFVKGHLKTVKAKGTSIINNQWSRAGSLYDTRFTGWEEQEYGRDTKQKRKSTITGRGGALTEKVKKQARFLPGQTFDKAENYPGNTTENRTVAMLHILKRKRGKKPFFLQGQVGNINYDKGLYQYIGGRIRMLQVRRKPKRPNKLPWMTDAREFAVRPGLESLWRSQIRYALRRYGK